MVADAATWRREGGSGNAKCISGRFMGALGAAEGNGEGGPPPAATATAALYALMDLPLKKRDIRDRAPPGSEDASLSLTSRRR